MSTSTINGSVSAAAFYELVQMYSGYGDTPEGALHLLDLLKPMDRRRLQAALNRSERPGGTYYLAGELADIDLLEQVVDENIEHLVESGNRELAFLFATSVEDLRRCERVSA